MRGKLIFAAIIAGATIIVAGGTWLLNWWLDQTAGHHWNEAIVASATIVLVVITGVYAYFTKELVRVQIAGIRRLGEDPHVRQLLSGLTTQDFAAKFYRLVRPFPLAGTIDDGDPEKFVADWLAPLRELIDAEAPQLSGALRSSCQLVSKGASTAQPNANWLAQAARAELQAALAAHRTPDWTLARAFFPGQKEAWEDLLKGEEFRALQQHYNILYRQLDAYITARDLSSQTATDEGAP